MEREVHVYLDTSGGPAPVGRLWARSHHGRQGATFVYDARWLRHPARFALEPALPLDPAPHHTHGGTALFGALGDSAPDRWGRELIRRQARRESRSRGVPPATFSEVDYLLRVSDSARLGALRFADAEDGAFLAREDAAPIPPLVRLPMLLRASDGLSADEDPDTSRDLDDWLRILLAPGSSLGGARPKAAIRDAGGRLAIAKFPARNDEVDVVRWEAVALHLAERAGIPVPERRLRSVGGRPVLVLARFDREGDGGEAGRIPFLSAMAALGAVDHETRCYAEFVDFLRRHGAYPKRDMRALWRRMVFNVLISNTDDHLRNHGFLHVAGMGWTLAPAYDLNPVPADVKPRILATAIDFDDPTASLELAFEAAPYFDLDAAAAREIAAEVAQATRGWRQAAADFGIARHEPERMASAFEHADLALALA